MAVDLAVKLFRVGDLQKIYIQKISCDRKQFDFM